MGENGGRISDPRRVMEVVPLAEQFDVVILGGGPAGYAAALYGAAIGLKIAMIEEARVGGTCLHRGCIPAKELLQTAEVLRTVKSAADFGVESPGSPTLNLGTSQTRKQSVIDKLTKGLESLLKGRKVTVIPGTGTVTDVAAHHVRVSDGTELVGDALFIATGSAPRSLPGLEMDGRRILSSDHVLELTEVPKRVAVIGGGAIGCEFASMLVDLGSEVTLLEVLPQILAGVDADVAKVVSRAFEKRGVKVRSGVRVRSIGPEADDYAVHFEGPKGEDVAYVDKVIVSVGRRPRTEGIGLEGTPAAPDERGFIPVDGRMRTGVPGVYALGDIVATPQLAHVAFAEAIVAVRDVLGENPPAVDYKKIPWGIYCHPEVGFCGLTEEQARDAGYDVVTATHRFAGDGRALIIGDTDGIVKFVSQKDGPILGVHIAGPWATELIAEGYLSVNWEATAGDIGALIHAHPTLSEVFGETAMALTGRVLH
jgi:dihydrolipoamide dehydrogenase